MHTIYAVDYWSSATPEQIKDIIKKITYGPFYDMEDLFRELNGRYAWIPASPYGTRFADGACLCNGYDYDPYELEVLINGKKTTIEIIVLNHEDCKVGILTKEWKEDGPGMPPKYTFPVPVEVVEENFEKLPF